MPIDKFTEILNRIRERYSANLPRISFAAYNEPTLDPFFKERLRMITKMGFTYWWLSNGSLMTEDLVEFLIHEKPRTTDYQLNLCSNVPEVLASSVGITPASAARTLSLLEKALPRLGLTGKKTYIKVHGDGGAEHLERVKTMREWAEPLGAKVTAAGVMGRAGMLPKVGRQIQHPHDAWLVCGASYLSNHYIGVDGEAYLCCHDYYKTTAFGNVVESDIVTLNATGARREKLAMLKKDFCARCECAIDVKKEPRAAFNLIARQLRRKLPLRLRKSGLRTLQTFKDYLERRAVAPG